MHIAPGCGAEDFELGVRDGLPVLTPVDDAGAFYNEYGWLHGVHTHEADRAHRRPPRPQRLAVPRGGLPAPLPGLLALRHRADLPRGRRVVHLGGRGAPADDRRRAHRRVDARALRQAHGGLAQQHGRLVHLAQALLGPAAAVLRVRRGAPDRRREQGRAARARDAGRRRTCEELHRPWIDPVRIRCGECENEAERVPEVGDCWLDAGIIPFSTLGYGRDEYVAGGFAEGAGEGLTKADLPGPRVLGALVPGRLGLGDARADPALVLLAALHVASRSRARPRTGPCSATRS